MLNAVKYLYRTVEQYATTSIAALLILILLPLSSYKSDDLENEKYLSFIASLESESTFGYFTVITVKDLKTGLIKEVCTKGNSFSSALHIELNADYEAKGSQKVINFAKVNKAKIFGFKKRKALDNISYFEYDDRYLPIVEKIYNINSAVAIIKLDNKFSIRLPRKEMLVFAHALFNRGYLSGESDCFGGTLVYIDRNKIDKKKP